MKNKGQLIAMILIVIFALVFTIKPWNFFKSSSSPGEPVQSTTEVTETTETAEITPSATPTPSPVPQNLYDINSSIYMD